MFVLGVRSSGSIFLKGALAHYTTTLLHLAFNLLLCLKQGFGTFFLKRIFCWLPCSGVNSAGVPAKSNKVFPLQWNWSTAGGLEKWGDFYRLILRSGDWILAVATSHHLPTDLVNQTCPLKRYNSKCKLKTNTNQSYNIPRSGTKKQQTFMPWRPLNRKWNFNGSVLLYFYYF